MFVLILLLFSSVSAQSGSESNRPVLKPNLRRETFFLLLSKNKTFHWHDWKDLAEVNRHFSNVVKDVYEREMFTYQTPNIYLAAFRDMLNLYSLCIDYLEGPSDQVLFTPRLIKNLTSNATRGRISYYVTRGKAYFYHNGHDDTLKLCKFHKKASIEWPDCYKVQGADETCWKVFRNATFSNLHSINFKKKCNKVYLISRVKISKRSKKTYKKINYTKLDDSSLFYDGNFREIEPYNNNTVLKCLFHCCSLEFGVTVQKEFGHNMMENHVKCYSKQLSHDDMKAFTFDCNLGENEEEPKKFLAVACKYDVVYNYHDQKLHFLEPHGRKGMALTELVPSKFFSECRRLSTVWNEANGMWPSFTCRMLVTRELFGKSKAELEAHLLGMLNSVRALAIEPNVPEMLLSSGGKFKISCLNRSMTPEEQLDTVTIVSRLLCYFAYDMESFDLTQLGIYNSDQHRYSLINSRASEAVHYTCNQERWNAKEWLEGCSCRMSAAFKNKHLHNVCCCSVIAFHDYMFAYSTAIFSALPNY